MYIFPQQMSTSSDTTTLNNELFRLIARARDEKLLPSNVDITEIEWSVDGQGQAYVIEWWPTVLRLASERVEVLIPKSLRGGYVFNDAVKLILKLIQKRQ